MSYAIKRAKADTKSATHADALDVGKRELEPAPVWRSLAFTHRRIHPKLEISQPGDPYELEADRIADRVMRMPAPSGRNDPALKTQTASLSAQRKCGPCEEEEEKLQRKTTADSRSPAPPPSTVDQVLNSAGQPLNPEIRSFMEQRFGQNFGHVRVHADARAAESALAVNARAYTVGSDIVFGASQFDTSSDDGKRLLAHELTHTMQQNGGGLSLLQRDEPTPLDLLLQGVGQLPPARIEDFCQPWSSLEEARRVHGIAVRNFLPMLSAQFGSEVGGLWRSYLSRPHGASLARRLFNDPTHRITRAFAESQTIRDRQTNLMPMVEAWFRRTCPTLPANFPMGIPASQIFPATELDFPINFNIPTEIPGHIAGGVGSSDAGPDTRRMEGSIVFFRSTNASGRTTTIRVRTDLQFIVRDAIDFCPGDPGTGLEQVLTVPLSRLEKSGEVWPAEPLAYDVPFEVRFTGEPINSEISSQAITTCDPQAQPPPPPSAERPAEPSPPPTEQPGRSLFRKRAEGRQEDRVRAGVNQTWQLLALKTNGNQSKLTVSRPDDYHEREADHVADFVMRLPMVGPRNPRHNSRRPSSASVALRGVQRKCNSCEELAVSAAPLHISRSPQSSTQDLHAELIEQYRRAHGLPPHGINPLTGQQEGPTDSEIRFGGLLDAWLRANQAATPTQQPGVATGPTTRSVPAPAQAPTILGRGTTSVVAACASAPDVGACRQHKSYVLNVLPQAIANIRSVRSPYSAAIADLYAATLPAAQAAAEPIPWGSSRARFGRSSDAPAPGSITVTFGGTTFTFNRFVVSLQQQTNGANGQALGIGTPTAFILLNEASNDALLGNLAGIEATMVHEMMHIFMAIVEARNAARAPGSPLVDRNLDRTSYATIQTSLETALLPFVTQIRRLPSFTSIPAPGTAQGDATSTAQSFLSETIARVEAGIFAKQRAGQGFTAADLRTLPRFFRTADYWSPTPPVRQELVSFITTNQAAIDAAIEPLIHRAGEMYLNLRP